MKIKTKFIFSLITILLFLALLSHAQHVTRGEISGVVVDKEGEDNAYYPQESGHKKHGAHVPSLWLVGITYVVISDGHYRYVIQ